MLIMVADGVTQQSADRASTAEWWDPHDCGAQREREKAQCWFGWGMPTIKTIDLIQSNSQLKQITILLMGITTKTTYNKNSHRLPFWLGHS